MSSLPAAHTRGGSDDIGYGRQVHVHACAERGR